MGGYVKGGTADICDSTALSIMETLWFQGAALQIYDPSGIPTYGEKMGKRQAPYQIML